MFVYNNLSYNYRVSIIRTQTSRSSPRSKDVFHYNRGSTAINRFDELKLSKDLKDYYAIILESHLAQFDDEPKLIEKHVYAP